METEQCFVFLQRNDANIEHYYDLVRESKNEDSILTKNMRYLVKKIFKNKYNCYVYKVNSKLGKIGETLETFACDRFISEIEYNTKKFNV